MSSLYEVVLPPLNILCTLELKLGHLAHVEKRSVPQKRLVCLEVVEKMRHIRSHFLTWAISTIISWEVVQNFEVIPVNPRPSHLFIHDAWRTPFFFLPRVFFYRLCITITTLPFPIFRHSHMFWKTKFKKRTKQEFMKNVHKEIHRVDSTLVM